jgi:hypothetical protein
VGGGPPHSDDHAVLARLALPAGGDGGGWGGVRRRRVLLGGWAAGVGGCSLMCPGRTSAAGSARQLWCAGGLHSSRAWLVVVLRQGLAAAAGSGRRCHGHVQVQQSRVLQQWHHRLQAQQLLPCSLVLLLGKLCLGLKGGAVAAQSLHDLLARLRQVGRWAGGQRLTAVPRPGIQGNADHVGSSAAAASTRLAAAAAWWRPG